MGSHRIHLILDPICAPEVAGGLVVEFESVGEAVQDESLIGAERGEVQLRRRAAG